MAWQVKESEYLIDRPFVTVRRDHVVLENGNELPDYFIFESVDFVNVIALTEAGHFILVHQYRHGARRADYELCAGMVESSDGDLLIAAQRELLEESGYGGGKWRLFDALSQNPAIHNNTSYTFLATGVRKLQPPDYDPGEEMTVHEVSREKLVHLLQSGQLFQALHTAPLWRYLYENPA